jgi:glycosyltransferase involved in cell wall biosynthesis
VHVQDVLYPSSAVAVRVSARRRVPSLVTLHVAFVPQRNRLLDAAERLALAAAGRIARRATRCVAYNPNVAAWTETAWRLPRVDVLPVGVEVHPVPPARAELGLPEDRFVAVFVGRDVAKKNLDAFAGAADPAYELVAVTDGRRDGLRTLPFMQPPDLHRVLASADAFVLPSRGEGIPLALQEAMALGLPVVTTLGPGYERYFDAGDVLAVDGTAAGVRTALRRLAADRELRERLAARSRAVAAAHFSLDAFVGAYERAYRDLTRSTPGRSSPPQARSARR